MIPEKWEPVFGKDHAEQKADALTHPLRRFSRAVTASERI
ncbi:MAG: hypothetical protein ACJAVZ_004053 [Afipia broomeae]|jgi:hypothetical protein